MSTKAERKPQGWKRVAKNLGRIPSDIVRPVRKWHRKRKLLSVAPLPTDSLQEPSIVFLAPEAGLGPHQANMAFLARSLQERGHRVFMTRCFDLFSRCPVMGAFQVPFDATSEQRRKACLSCTSIAKNLSHHFDVPSIDLRSLLSDPIRSSVKQAIANAPDDLTEFQFEDIAFGKLSTVDLVLATKRHRLHQVDGEDRQKWLKLIESSLLMYLLVDELCKKANVKTLVHHNDYSLLLGGKLAAKKHGADVRSVTLAYHKNIDQGKIVIYPTYWPVYNQQVAEAWPEWRDRPIHATQVGEVIDDLIVRTSGAGSHIYSSARSNAGDAVRSIGLDPAKKLIVAYTSSLDELIAGKMLMDAVDEIPHTVTQPFEDQIDWLKALVGFVANRQDLQLAVRVHPREGANHRESTVSEHLPELKAAFSELPPNCRFVWPGEKTSSYDLGEAAEVVLTSWSTIGIEMARFGVPVLAAFRVPEAPYPVDDFLKWAPTKDRYFDRLEKMLSEQPNAIAWQHAIRWYHLANLCVSIDVNDAVEPLKDGMPWKYQSPARIGDIERLLVHGEVVHDVNRELGLPDDTPESRNAEIGAMRQQLDRLIHYLAFGVTSMQDQEQKRIEWTATGNMVTWTENQVDNQIYSPMLGRLIRFADSLNDDIEVRPTKKIA